MPNCVRTRHYPTPEADPKHGLEMGMPDTREIAARGVYRARYLVGGRPVFFAVLSTGERFRQVILRRDVSEDDVVEWLWRELDRVNPAPQLRLVEPVRAKFVPTEVLDAQYRDADPIRRRVHLGLVAQKRGGTVS